MPFHIVHAPLQAKDSDRSGQSAKVERILQSIWGGELCDTLSGLDPNVAQSVLAMITLRAQLGGDADALLRPLLNRKESLS